MKWFVELNSSITDLRIIEIVDDNIVAYSGRSEVYIIKYPLDEYYHKQYHHLSYPTPSSKLRVFVDDVRQIWSEEE